MRNKTLQIAVAASLAMLVTAPAARWTVTVPEKDAPMAGPGGVRLRGAPGFLPDFYKLDGPYRWRWAGPNAYPAGR